MRVRRQRREALRPAHGRQPRVWHAALLGALAICVIASVGTPAPAIADASVGAITGHVVNDHDGAVAGVVVSTTDATGTVYEAVTGPTGSFKLAGLPAPDHYELTFVPPPGYAPSTFSSSTTPGTTTDIGYITVQGHGGSITGVVTDRLGVPLYGMEVQVSAYDQTVTGRDGRYTLTGLMPGRYTLTVIDGNDRLPEGTVAVAANTSTVNVTLPPPEVPSGTEARDAARDVAYLNGERAALGLPAGILQNTRWSIECAAHDHYLNDNHLLQHPENPAQPGASAGGAWAGNSAVLSEGAAWTATHNPWENGPIHLSQLFAPSLSVIGIDQSDGYACATTVPGQLRPSVRKNTIYTYPGDHARGIPPREVASENPFVPQQFVGIRRGRATGRELFVYLNKPREVGQAPVIITSASMRSRSGRVELRWVNTTTKRIGPFLYGAILVPVRPLQPKTEYRVTVTVRTQPGRLAHTWTFMTAGRPAVKHHR